MVKGMQRREALRIGLGFIGLAGLVGWDAITGAVDAQTPACTLVPQQTAGPFYFDTKQVRRDISEGLPGIPLALTLQVVDAATCAVVAGALVDIWHADAAGIYSGYAGQGDGGDIDATGEDFMRGIQVSDAAGRVEFATVYPGWYPGRTTHIHFKILLDRQTTVTSQLYFPDAFSDVVYAQSPYSGRAKRNTSNQNDALTRAGDLSALTMALATQGAGYRASHVIGIAGGATAVAPSAWGWLKDVSR